LKSVEIPEILSKNLKGKDMYKEFPRELTHPIDVATVLRKRRGLKRELLEQANLMPSRIAILGGSTTAEVMSMLELFLLANGIQPTFYESEYNRYSEDVLFENPELWGFNPEIIYLHTTWHNVSQFPELLESEVEADQRVRQEMSRFVNIWEKIQSKLGALVIQNNFDLPPLRPLGNLEVSAAYGRVNYLMRLNSEFANYARTHSRFLIHDIQYLSAQVGLNAWFDPTYWYSFHTALSPTATVALARSLAAMIKSVYGKTKKCLVLDLDNTLWGGVIGDEGVQGLLLGRDNPVGEAFQNFQRYVKELQRRGVLLAVCSKNEPETAPQGFSHPDSILKLEDFSAFKANWNPKPDNIREIAFELNIGLDSFVFVDDNPAERALVAAQLPEVAVPDVGSDVTKFADALEQERYFEVNQIVKEDMSRGSYYSANVQRNVSQGKFQNYGEFLSSLEMVAEIAPFVPVYLERITQLINKTNQFNLTTRRYTAAEVEAMAKDPQFLTLYGRLSDKFGDNGLVSVLVGRATGETLEIDIWLMSCRVLKREVELAMFDTLVEQCQARCIRKIVGVYIPTKKNAMVSELYGELGFTIVDQGGGGHTVWQYEIPHDYTSKSSHIHRASPVGSTIQASGGD
jgi:FkbH-like protein